MLFSEFPRAEKSALQDYLLINQAQGQETFETKAMKIDCLLNKFTNSTPTLQIYSGDTLQADSLFDNNVNVRLSCSPFNITANLSGSINFKANIDNLRFGIPLSGIYNAGFGVTDIAFNSNNSNSSNELDYEVISGQRIYSTNGAYQYQSNASTTMHRIYLTGGHTYVFSGYSNSASSTYPHLIVVEDTSRTNTSWDSSLLNYSVTDKLMDCMWTPNNDSIALLCTPLGGFQKGSTVYIADLSDTNSSTNVKCNVSVTDDVLFITPVGVVNGALGETKNISGNVIYNSIQLDEF